MNKLVKKMKLLPLVVLVSVMVIISSNSGQCHTPLSMARAMGRFIRQPIRTITRFPLHVVSKVHAAKKAFISKVALAIFVKGALLKKPLLLWKTITGAKLVAKKVSASPASARSDEEGERRDVQVPLELRMAPITIKSYFHTKGTRFDLSGRREQQPVRAKSSQSINQPSDRSLPGEQRDSPMQALPRVTLV